MKERIKAAMAAAIAAGYTIVDGSWFSATKKHCCPVAAICMAEGNLTEHELKRLNLEATAADILGLPTGEVESLWRGFDNAAYWGGTEGENMMYEIGNDLRKEWLGE